METALCFVIGYVVTTIGTIILSWNYFKIRERYSKKRKDGGVSVKRHTEVNGMVDYFDIAPDGSFEKGIIYRNEKY